MFLNIYDTQEEEYNEQSTHDDYLWRTERGFETQLTTDETNSVVIDRRRQRQIKIAKLGSRNSIGKEH
uniref:Uncharacterized protein n=1 Tax=Heterorhabditis bacteriophora TaxID=37862 RepID=A0A1I7XBE0_HETBA